MANRSAQLMRRPARTPSIVLISGTPGVGKSTVAHEAARQLARAVHIKADVLHRMILTGGEWPSAGTPEAMRQLVLRTRNAALLARSFWEAGFDVFLDEVVATKQQLTALDTVLARAPLHIVVLEAAPSVVLERDDQRDKHTAANYVGVAAQIRELLGDRATFVDSSHLSVEETVAAVRAVTPTVAWS